MFTIYKHFGDFVKCIFTILLQIFQHEKDFLPTRKHQQAKVRRFLVICLYDYFIYGSNFIFRKASRNEMPSWLWSQNTEYIAMDIRVIGANQNARKLLFTDLVNAKKGLGDLPRGRASPHKTFLSSPPGESKICS